MNLQVFDLLKLNPVWKTNISKDVNKQLSTSFKAKLNNGILQVVNEADVDMAGGLVSTNVDIPAGATHFGMDMQLEIDMFNFNQLSRCENDLKITFPGGAQANGSLQWNADKKIWQVGANDGSGWVDTPYTEPLDIGDNLIQLRMTFDGKLWGFEGLAVNEQAPWVPAASFKNLPANQTGWTPGLHPQIQTECKKAPWYLVEYFHKFQLITDTIPIPFSFSY